MSDLVRRIVLPPEARRDWERFLTREWLVTNGLGGYASGTVVGVPTRRYHGLLIAALASPFGRTVMFNRLLERIILEDARVVQLGRHEKGEREEESAGECFPSEFRLESGLPVWRYEVGGEVFERRVLMPYRQNSVHISYVLVEGSGRAKLQLEPALHFRKHDSPVGGSFDLPYRITVMGDRVEVSDGSDLPGLRIKPYGAGALFTLHGGTIQDVYYRAEDRRGYESYGRMWTPGYFEFALAPGANPALVASTEEWESVLAVEPAAALPAERERRRLLIAAAHPDAQSGVGAEMVLAGDQFLIAPRGRPEDAARAHAAGEELRTMVAGYHWFTDWGRDTMISLEGLTLQTGRWTEAGWILRTFAHYMREGLVPNMFPEGGNEGLYNTADATLWFFHAVDRYVRITGDSSILQVLLPRLEESVEHHLRGTLFGIHVDPADGLLHQGAAGYQLTWMDAKVDDWVVTPRRGKAVEINALWYNALKLLESWLRDADRHTESQKISELAHRARDSFNRRFWNAGCGYLFDVVDGENGDDPACRPNQVFAISLPNPVLDSARWKPVLEVIRSNLLTPVGLRSLAPGSNDYHPKYDGDLRSRDAAYHQGTVWGWLIGPFVDAWRKSYPEDRNLRRFLHGLVPHLDEACIGSMSEIFDAETPFNPRGCIAQAWTVAEFLRCWLSTRQERETEGR